ncbi:MAG: glycoside hydrolase family 43 protein [Prevotella sp.]|nr:glycoside hydrolase family 43 protein [Prevotella sp.]
MKRILSFLLLALLSASTYAYTLNRVSVHDPSIVWDPATQSYYIFGSHRASAKSTDLMSWNAFTAAWKTPTSNNASNTIAFKENQTKTIVIGGQEVTFGNFDAFAWSSAYGNGYNIDGNMWAPDVIYNNAMGKWCMYLSINGPTWNSSIILLTADRITGPYMYQGPVVFSGFNVTSTEAVNYKHTDLELAIGEQTNLPGRYNVGNKWGSRWPHAIDPCVFYDEEGKLWMSYGSWSGGIWMLELDEATGLRDYDVNYAIQGNGDGVTSDPYFGKKIAGGYYVSGEASYIEHIGNHYFLFVTYGGLAAGGNPDDYNNGGYQMRVFRSANPNGPYVDANGVNAIFANYKLNFGPNATDNRGVNIFGAYGEWGFQTVGTWSERSQGHNSILAAEDGRTYLVYHTRFQNRGEGHEVRVHQVFQNTDGWLVAAPFEYTGEQVTSADIATTQQVATSDIPGNYKLLIHKYKLDHTHKELATPVEIQLNGDGTISGNNTGKWSIQEGTSYITITLGNTIYKGVMVEQTLEKTNIKAASFTAMTKSGVSIWGYRTGALAGIEEVTTFKDIEAPVYDLQGRRVNTPMQKGIYIKNGKKYIKH